VLTEPVQNETTEEELPPPPRRGLTEKEQERKKELQTKKAKAHDKLPKKEEEELVELLAAEKAEHDRQAAIHRLTEAADKYGRKTIGQVQREVTDRVKVFGEDEKKEIAGVNQIYASGRKEMEKETKAAMQKIQERHNEGMAALQRSLEESAAEVRERYRGHFIVAEAELNRRTEEIANQIGSFTEEIKALELPQLETLLKDGLLPYSSSPGTEGFLVVPGAGKEG